MSLKAKLSAAINRANMGPGDGQKKKSTTVSTPTIGFTRKENPMSKPLINTSVKKPASTTNVIKSTPAYSAPAAAPTAPATKTARDVRAEGRMKITEARVNKRLDKINNPKTPEQKQERNQNIAKGVGKAAGAVVGGLELVDRIRQTFPSKKAGN